MSTERDGHFVNESSSSSINNDDGEVMSTGGVPTAPNGQTSNGNDDSACNPNTDDDTPTKKKFSVPEPCPRWRFVNEAKKTLGYSSVAAGKVVKGLSAEELVGTYNVPEWEVTNGATVENVEVTSTEMDVEAKEQEKSARKVGKLEFQEGGEEVEETFEGTFGGFRRSVQVEVKEEKVEEQASSDDNDLPTEPEMAVIVKATHTDDDDDELDQVEKQMKVGEPAPESAVPTPPPSSQSSNDNQSDEEVEKPSLPDEQQQPQYKRKWPFLVLLLVVGLAAVLGVVFGSKNSDNDSGSNNAINGHDIMMSGETNGTTNAPTFAPTSMVSSQKQGHFFIWVG